MRLRDDQRAAAMQVGAIILFGFIVLTIAIWQAQVVPSENATVEFNHNERVQDDMQDVRGQIVSSVGGGLPRSVAVDMAPEYPARTIFVNPGAPDGTLRTVGTANTSLQLVVDNAVAADDSVADFWNGSARPYNTGGILYAPGYREYTGAPTTVYENSVLYNRQGDGTPITLSGQDLIDGRTVSLVALNGSLSRTKSDTYSVDLEAMSSSTNTVSVSDDGTGNVTIRFASRRDGAWWNETLAAEHVDEGGYVHDVRSTPLGDGFHRVTVELVGGESYQLRMAKVGVGSDREPVSETYMLDVEGDGASVPEGSTQKLVVEVRDAFNNPVPGVVVEGNASTGSLVESNLTTGSDGRVTFTYDAPNIAGSTADVEVDFSFDVDPATTAIDPDAPEDVRMNLTINGGGGAGGGGGAYTIDWQDPDADNPSGSLSSCDATNCTWDVGADGDSRLDLRAATDPIIEELDTEFAVNDSSVGSLSTGDADTGSNGEATTTLNALSNGTVDVYVVTGDASDVITIEVTNVTGINRPPTANFTYSPTDPETGETVEFDPSGSTDPENNVTEYRWDFDGDGSFETTTTTATNVTWTYSDDGDYDVTLEVVDNESNTDTETRTVSVQNRPPTANFTVSCNQLTCSFDGGGSSDPDGFVGSYDWEFGDGTTGTGETVDHTYNSAGTYTVNLTVTDDDGDTNTTSMTITVSDNKPPTANFTYSPTDPETGETVEFDPSGSSDPENNVTEYRWDFDGDGSFEKTTSSETNVTWTYSDDGDYDVTLEVVDNESNTGTETRTVSVQNRPPAANFTYSPERPVPGETVTFDASNSTDPDGTVEYYVWDFDGDGTVDLNTTSATVDHSYSTVGTKNPTLRVIDDDGAENVTDRTVQVVGGKPDVAYIDPGTQDGRTIDTAGRISTFDMEGSAEAIGPPEVDFDGDGFVEIPYTDGGYLKLVDRNGERQTLRPGDVKDSAMTVGQFRDDAPAVYWANNNDEKSVYRTYLNGTTETLGTFGDTVRAIGGIGDIDDDSADELVVVISGPTLAYIDDDGSTLSALNDFVGSNNNFGAGRVADYDGDGAERAAVVDGSNDVLLVSCSKENKNKADCTTTRVHTETARKTPLGAFDWTGDSESEVMFASTSDPAKLRYVEVSGSGTGASGTAYTVTDENGNVVAVYATGGVASVYRLAAPRRPVG